MPPRNPSTRYYVHGDAHEDRADTYYCARCDAFVGSHHFADPAHVQSRAEKYRATLDAWKRHAKKARPGYYRPESPINIIEADAISDESAARAARSQFYRWLTRQQARDDPIGDLAADAVRDKGFPVTANDLPRLHHHLLRRGASPEAHVALDEAWGAFKAKGKRRAGLTPSQRFEVFKRDGYRCRLCGCTADDNRRLEVDHKVPVAKGGTNEPANLWTLCAECNRGKSDSDL